jgi:major membrane immunogen (membrane-anchored lipoprotein)
MPKRKGLGRDITRSLETMSSLLACLHETVNMPLKRGLQVVKISDDKLAKEVDDVMGKAFELKNAVIDLKHKIGNLKEEDPQDSRFAKNVVARFLEMDVQ